MLATTTILRRATRVLSRSPLATYAQVAGVNNIQLQRRNYHENIVEHYENPRNVGSLDKNSDDVGTVSDSVVYYCTIRYVAFSASMCSYNMGSLPFCFSHILIITIHFQTPISFFF